MNRLSRSPHLLVSLALLLPLGCDRAPPGDDAQGLERSEQLQNKLCEGLDSARWRICADAVAIRAEHVGHNSSDELALLREIIAELRVDAEFICKVRRRDALRCTRTGTLLGHAELTKAEAVVADLNALSSKYAMNARVAFKCENGEWRSATEKDEPVVGQAVSAVYEARMRLACASAVDKGADTVGPAVPADFTGATGFDPTPGFCGFAIGEPESTDFIEKARDRSEKMAAECATSLIDSLFEDPEDPPPEDPAPEDPPPEDPPEDPPPDPDSAEDPIVETETIVNNGDGTETVTRCSGGECNSFVRYRTTTWDRVIRGTHESGHKSESAFRDDGSQRYRGTSPSGESWNIEIDADGNVTNSGRKQNKDGTWTSWKRKGFDCLDESCSTCERYLETHPKLAADCSGALEGTPGAGELCAQFGDVTDCCSHPGGPPVDPLLILPNQGHDMVCLNTAIDVQSAACAERCKAVDEDCTISCISAVPVDFGFSLFDQVCLAAYSEDCFTPESNPPDPTTPPLPLPYGDGVIVDDEPAP